MTPKQNPNRDLADYLHRRLKYLEQCYAEIESKFSEDKADVCRKIDRGIYNRRDPAIGKIIFHIEYVVANTFRYTMLVGGCSFLEEAIKEITKRLIPDYDARIKDIERGNWLHKHIQLLSDSADLQTVSLRSDLDRFHDFITLRNCIVHAWGKVREARDPAAVKAASQRIDTAEVSKDGFLVLGNQVIPEAIISGENIVESILTSELDVSMT